MSISPILTDESSALLDRFHPSTHGGRVVAHRLSNASGMEAYFTNYGARLIRLRVPDSEGRFDDVVLGYDTLQDYLDSIEKYYGATIGRVGNRIANGHFMLDGTSRKLFCNQPPNHLHGGNNGFHNVVWDVADVGESSLTYRYVASESKDGYPGTLTVEVTFSLEDEDALRITYEATTDAPTLVNLTNHAYFNLAGAGSGSVARHHIRMMADSFTPVTPSMIPTGEILSVTGTPFDLRESTPMGRHWNSSDEQIQIAGGYDHNFVLRKTGLDEPELAARVEDPASGRILDVLTTEPGIQFYTANALSGLDVGREGVAYMPRTAFCLETQHYPDSPNQPGFPSIRLDPADTYRSTTVYRFGTA